MIKQQDLNLEVSRTIVIDNGEATVGGSRMSKFKFPIFVRNTIHSRFVQQFMRFVLYSLLAVVILGLINKQTSNTIYSTVQMEQTDKNIFLRKQIPGLFPPLSTNWTLLLNKWSILTIRGSQLTSAINPKSYQLQFKHFQDKSDLLYITRDNCNGHVIMNWQTYSSNIFLSEFEPPHEGMIIPNQPEDEQCILEKGEIIDILKQSTIWTVSEEDGKLGLFILIEKDRVDRVTSNSNLVLIANQVKKD